MGHFRRRRPRRSVRCCLCTPHRFGNLGRRPVDLEDGEKPAKKGKAGQIDRPYLLESRRRERLFSNDKPRTIIGWGDWGPWHRDYGRYATEKAAIEALKARRRGWFADIYEFRIRVEVEEASVEDFVAR